MATTGERMIVNAAIERLIARSDEDSSAAAVVINYGSKIRLASSCVQLDFSARSKDTNEHTSGYSPGIGEIEATREGPDAQKEFTFGIYKDRVGYYRLERIKEGLILFHHFWKSDQATNADGTSPDVYYLGYDPKTLMPKYLGILRERTALRLWIGTTIEFTKQYLEPVYGTVPKLGTIGIKVY